jgi:hypothetical protein
MSFVVKPQYTGFTGYPYDPTDEELTKRHGKDVFKVKKGKHGLECADVWTFQNAESRLIETQEAFKEQIAYLEVNRCCRCNILLTVWYNEAPHKFGRNPTMFKLYNFNNTSHEPRYYYDWGFDTTQECCLQNLVFGNYYRGKGVLVGQLEEDIRNNKEFNEIVKKIPNISLVDGQDHEEEVKKGRQLAKDFLESHPLTPLTTP